MAKNIVIYSDGTGQVGGLKPNQRLSNIYKMYKASKVGPSSNINPKKQIAFYDPGLGSGEKDNSLLSHPIKLTKKLLSSALGIGLNTNITDCYEAILKYYEPGDRVYLFGFSRGAYTVRCVANVMNLCGIPTHDAQGRALPRQGKKLRAIAEEAVFKVYEHGISKNRRAYYKEREEQGRRFREKYGSQGQGRDGEEQGNIQPYFIGLFDTVAALGISKMRKIILVVLGSIVFYFLFHFIILSPTFSYFGIALLSISILLGLYVLKQRFRYIRHFPKKNNFSWHIKSWGLKHYDIFLDNLVPYARHALSIDEERESFPRVKWGQDKDFKRTKDQQPAWLKQVWFAGNHSDIGGSYPENESRLSDIALQWMIEEIQEVEYPILFNKKMLRTFPDYMGMQHCEIQYVKDRFWPRRWPKFLRFSWSRKIRKVHPHATLHDSVLKRFKSDSIHDYNRKKPYRPESLKMHEKVTQYYNKY